MLKEFYQLYVIALSNTYKLYDLNTLRIIFQYIILTHKRSPG